MTPPRRGAYRNCAIGAVMVEANRDFDVINAGRYMMYVMARPMLGYEVI